MKMPKLQGGADLSVKNRNRPPLRGCVICYSSRLAFSLEPQLAQKSRFPKSFFLSLSLSLSDADYWRALDLHLIVVVAVVGLRYEGGCRKLHERNRRNTAEPSSGLLGLGLPRERGVAWMLLVVRQSATSWPPVLVYTCCVRSR